MGYEMLFYPQRAISAILPVHQSVFYFIWDFLHDMTDNKFCISSIYLPNHKSPKERERIAQGKLKSKK